MNYDIIVIGGGHAGIEATFAAANRGMQVTLITEHLASIGHMPCNPSIGGSAKGIVVREISALGGVMAELADQSLLQIKMLNQSKGPAVWSLRAQVDIELYSELAREKLLAHPRISVIEKRVDEFIVHNETITGVMLNDGTALSAQAVIVTAGTYMDATILVGHEKTKGGPNGYKTSEGLSQSFKALGFEMFRLKTGTPARVRRDSIDYRKMEIQPGDTEPWSFSTKPNATTVHVAELPCYLTYAEQQTIDVIQANLAASAMYSGNVKGVGPRYCPSIEDKVVRFSDKERHQIFIEPITLANDLMYIQGMSTSMPPAVQEKMLKAIAGLENCEIVQYGYAIEYDALKPTQLQPSLETKYIAGLYTAGQINGTSGYEEAAIQGLIAGINAVNKIKGLEPLILGRDEAYAGVMIDDLVTKGTQDPYRLLTSRAEYRLLLRHDNADLRLGKYAYQYGLMNEQAYQALQDKKAKIVETITLLETLRITPKAKVIDYLNDNGYSLLHDGIKASVMLKRSEISWEILLELLTIMEVEAEIVTELLNLPKTIKEQVTIQIKYEGYINKAKQQVLAAKKLEYKKIPEQLDYDVVPNLALEAKEKLAKIKPLTLGQASRIAGVNAVDITMLDLYLSQQEK